MLEEDIGTFVSRRMTTAELSPKSKIDARRNSYIVAEPLERLLLKQIARSNWTRTESPKHIASHIDHIKFGRDDYGYGIGTVEVKTTENPMFNTTTSFPRVEKQPAYTLPSYKLLKD